MPRESRVRKPGPGITDSAFTYFWWEGLLTTSWAVGKSEEEIADFWVEHRVALLENFIERNRQKGGDPGKRPRMFWDELEESGIERRQTGTTRYWDVSIAGGGWETEPEFETDMALLIRGKQNVADWEMEAWKPKKRKKTHRRASRAVRGRLKKKPR